MIRAAILLTLFTLLFHKALPLWRAVLFTPVHGRCLKVAPKSESTTQVQALICGQSLRSTAADWRALGLVHLLVVSGSHLIILAKVLGLLLTLLTLLLPKRPNNPPNKPPMNRAIVFVGLLLFTCANRLQPPVLRSMTQWSVSPWLTRRGWSRTEIGLISTWFALPFLNSSSELLSLALSWFASLALEGSSQLQSYFGRNKLLVGISAQILIWWLLLPLLLLLSVPHPLVTLGNIVLAPLLGLVLVPAALATWISGVLDPNQIWQVPRLFDQLWSITQSGIHWLAIRLPAPLIVQQTWTMSRYCVALGALGFLTVWGFVIRTGARTGARTDLNLSTIALMSASMIASLVLGIALFNSLKSDPTPVPRVEVPASREIKRMPGIYKKDWSPLWKPATKLKAKNRSRLRDQTR